VKACPQVLHLQVAFDLITPAVPGMSRPISLGRKASTSSPPHCRHCRIAIALLLPQARNPYLIRIAQCSAWGPRTMS